MPRYLLAWMTTEVKQGGPAIQDDGLTLDLGGSMRAFRLVHGGRRLVTGLR